MKTSNPTIEDKIEQLLDDPRRLKKLFAIEKERRGVPQNKLVFLSMANIAEQLWCSMQSVLTTQEEEARFFESYLFDRLKYANKLGLFTKWPRKLADLLTIGEEITYAQVAEMEAKRIAKAARNWAENAEKIAKIRAKAELLVDGPDWQVRGQQAEFKYAEIYHRFRWNFSWESYVVVGIPDGITESLVYEFKSTKRARYKEERFVTAGLQADLYGLFFERAEKRLQVFSADTDQIETRNAPVSKEQALWALNNFRRVDYGELPRLPAPFKCRVCRVAESCPLLTDRAGASSLPSVTSPRSLASVLSKTRLE